MGFLKFCRRMMDRGGFATVGLFGVLLLENEKCPSYLSPIAYGIAAVGTCGFIKFIVMDLERIHCDECIRDLENIKATLERRAVEIAGMKADSKITAKLAKMLEGWFEEMLKQHTKINDIQEKLTRFLERHGKDAYRKTEKAYMSYQTFQNVQGREQMKRILQQNLDVIHNEMARCRANEPKRVSGDMLTSAESSEMLYQELDKLYIEALMLLDGSGTKTFKEIISELLLEQFKEHKEETKNQPEEKEQMEHEKSIEKSDEKKKEKELEGKTETNLSKKNLEKEKYHTEENMGDQAESIPEENTKNRERNFEKNVEEKTEKELQGKDKNMQEGSLERGQVGKVENIETKKEEYGGILDENMGKKQEGTEEKELQGKDKNIQEGNLERGQVGKAENIETRKEEHGGILDENMGKKQEGSEEKKLEGGMQFEQERNAEKKLDENLQKEQTKNIKEESGKLQEQIETAQEEQSERKIDEKMENVEEGTTEN